jgi:hypothetical protein
MAPAIVYGYLQTNFTMKHICLLLATFIALLNTGAQSLKKYAIGTSGCSVYLFCEPGNFGSSYSEDSAIVYTGDCKTADSSDYGFICVQLKQTTADMQVAEELLVAYLDYLKTALNITAAAGYGKGHILNGNVNTRGIIDYWTDKTGDEWKMKAWTDGRFIAVLYVYASGTLKETEKMNVFLDGFRFPANVHP